MLLAVIDLMEEGEITSPSIELSDNLDRKFNAIWRRYLGESSIYIFRSIAVHFRR